MEKASADISSGSALWTEYENVIDSELFSIQKRGQEGRASIPGFPGALIWKRATPQFHLGSPSGNIGWNGAESMVGVRFAHQGVIGPLENAEIEYSNGSAENTLTYSARELSSKFTSLLRQQELKVGWTSRVVYGVNLRTTILYGWREPSENQFTSANRTLENGTQSRLDWSMKGAEQFSHWTVSGSYSEQQQTTEISSSNLVLASNVWRNTRQDILVKFGAPVEDLRPNAFLTAGVHLWTTSYLGRAFDIAGNPLTRIPFG